MKQIPDQVVFAHVSDPHFVEERVSDEPVRAMGQNGHDLLLCQDLPAALADLRERTGHPDNLPLPVVMSGDPTRKGLNPGEFIAGREYFEATWPNPQNQPTWQYALGLGQQNVVSIPGNHDHWDGDIRNQCHHSFQGCWPISWFFGSLELHADSQQALRYLAGRYSVAAILTGHTHDFLADRYDLVDFSPHQLREFRSATTLQAEARPFRQGFYGHQIVLDGGQVSWTAHPYQWQGSYFYPLAVDPGIPASGQWNPFRFQVTS
jgi:hypothetical protein